MRSLKVNAAVLLGFALSFIPNNFREEKYQNIAFYVLIGFVIIAFLGNFISNRRQRAV